MKWENVFSQVKDTHIGNILTGVVWNEGKRLKEVHAVRMFEHCRKLLHCLETSAVQSRQASSKNQKPSASLKQTARKSFFFFPSLVDQHQMWLL